MPSDLLSINLPLKWDYRLGLRAAGLVVYGALPASLGALGALKAPESAVSSISWTTFPFIAVVAAIPVALTFVLVRQRLQNWYLLPDYLYLRTLVITSGIILASTAVCMATGILKGAFHIISFQDWLALSPGKKATPWLECLLLSFAYLVGAATLFLTVVKEDGNLPLLPKKGEIDALAEVRTQLRNTQRNLAGLRKPERNDTALKANIQLIIASIEAAKVALASLHSGPLSFGRLALLLEVATRLGALAAALRDVEASYAKWNDYFGAGPTPQLGNEERERRRQIERLIGMRLHG
jgi:hypothetical protein